MCIYYVLTPLNFLICLLLYILISLKINCEPLYMKLYISKILRPVNFMCRY